MGENETNKDPIPEQFESFEELSEFWETHDLTDYEESLEPVDSIKMVSEPKHEYVITLSETLDELLHKAEEKEGVPIKKLINLWVQEKLLLYQSGNS